MVLELTNSQFILLFLVWTALIFIVTSLTHTHDIDAEEVAVQGVEKIEEKVTQIIEENWEIIENTSLHDWASWHKAPEGF